MQINYKLIILLSVAPMVHATQPIAPDYTQQLPPELKAQVARYLSDAQTVTQAANNLKKLMVVNTKWKSALSTYQFTDGFIGDLYRKFGKPTPLIAAQMNTPATFNWMKEKLKNDVTGNFKKVLDISLDTEISSDKSDKKVITFLAQGGANINNASYLIKAITKNNSDLVKLLISLGNKELNNSKDEQGHTFSGPLQTSLNLYKSYSQQKDKTQERSEQAEIIRTLLAFGAIPNQYDVFYLEQEGLKQHGMIPFDI